MKMNCAEDEVRELDLPLPILPESDDPEAILRWYQLQQLADFMDRVTVKTADGRSYRRFRRIVRNGEVSWTKNPDIPDAIERKLSNQLSAAVADERGTEAGHLDGITVCGG